MRKVALLALAVLLNGNVYADGDALDNLPYANQYEDGFRLLKRCESKDDFSLGKCLGYLEGVADSVWYNGISIPLASPSEYFIQTEVCVPSSVTSGQLIKVWVKWANENVILLNWAATSLVMDAFSEAWPCKPGVTP